MRRTLCSYKRNTKRKQFIAFILF